MDKRQEIAEKIRNLRAKAGNVASTEAEAAQAAAMIAKLLARYDMTEEDVREYDKDKTSAVNGSLGERMHPVLSACWKGITELTETTAYQNKYKELCFIGMVHDVEMALYLSEIITSAADRALKAGFPAASKHERQSFYKGFGDTIRHKLLELAEDRKQAKTATGTAIVIRKTELVTDFMSAAGLNLKGKSSGRSRRVDMRYYAAGRTVGGAVNLSRPLRSTAGGTTSRLK